MRRLTKLLALPWEDRALLLEALLRLLAAKLELRMRGAGPCLARLEQAQPRRRRTATPARLEKVAAAVRRASAHLPLVRLTCLPQSLAVGWMLARRGIATRLHIGARTDGGALQAHAWVTASELTWSFGDDPEFRDLLGG